MKTMKNTKKTESLMSNTNIAIFVVVALVIAAFMWKSAKKMVSLSPTEVVEVDQIEDTEDLAQAAQELDSINVDGDIDPDLSQVYTNAQMMK